MRLFGKLICLAIKPIKVDTGKIIHIDISSLTLVVGHLLSSFSVFFLYLSSLFTIIMIIMVE